MPEIAPFAIVFRIPVVGELHQGCPLGGGACLVLRSGEKDQRVAACLAVGTTDLLHAKLFAVKIEAVLDIGDANHGVEIAERHWGSLLKRGRKGQLCAAGWQGARVGTATAGIEQRWMSSSRGPTSPGRVAFSSSSRITNLMVSNLIRNWSTNILAKLQANSSPISSYPRVSTGY